MNSTSDSPRTLDDLTSYVVDLAQYETDGLCANYTLRRHRYEPEANAGSHEARSDWIKYIGPVEQFGGCNPLNGNFTAVVLPLCMPERLRLIAYIHEFAFLYDNIVEIANSATSGYGDDCERQMPRNPALGKKQIEAKMLYQLTQTDKKCSERVMRVWKEMIDTTVRDQSKNFRSLEEYVEFRIVDTGAPFVEALLLFGMGMQLTAEEDESLAPVVHPCFAALGLANDYFSFDREWEEFAKSGADRMTNAVWLHMQWYNVDVRTAKDMVRETTANYERKFLEQCEIFRSTNAPISEKLDRYLNALHYEISGNVVWSLNCPRYHPRFRYDANAGIEDRLTEESNPGLHMQSWDAASHRKGTLEQGSIGSPEQEVLTTRSERSASSGSVTIPSEGSSTASAENDDATTPSTYSESSDYASKRRTSIEIPRNAHLTAEVIKAPFEYIRSLPSKGLRDVFIDALNIWFDVPQQTTARIKNIVGRLHSASLLLDDFEDGSELRRGSPAAHAIFGAPQTINSANFAIIEAVAEARRLDFPEAIDIVLADLLDLHIGQSHDLHWTRHTQCPSEDEYLEMVGKKTGGLFRLSARLMLCAGTRTTDSKSKTDVEKLVELIGVHFQIRDDYQNLQSAEYSSQKGFCEDLDEGKFSFPLIHALTSRSSTPEALQLREILQRRRDVGHLSESHKRLVLDLLERTGSLEYTRQTLQRLQDQIEEDVGKLEGSFGMENWVMRMLLLKLGI